MDRTLNLIARVCAGLAALFLSAMMLLVVADVVLRSLFKYPIQGSVELVELLLAGTFFVALPAAFARDEHLLVDMIDQWWPKVVPWCKRIAAVVAIVILATMAWQGFKFARDVVELGDVTSDLSLPRILYWIPVLFGIIGAAIVAVLLIFKRRQQA